MSKRFVPLAAAVIVALCGAAHAQTMSPAAGLSAIVGPTLSNNAGILNTTQPADRIVTASTDTILSTDGGRIVNYHSTASVAASLPAATGAAFTQGFAFDADNNGGGSVTITPASGEFIGNLTSLLLPQATGCNIRSDSVNYQVDPAGCPALAYNPIFSTSTFTSALDPRFTVTNATTGICSYYNSSGILSYTSTGLCANRVDYNPSTLAYNGILIEPATTNLVPYSNIQIGGNWGASGVTVVGSAVTSPDGTSNATSLTSTGTGNQNNQIYSIGVTSGTNYVVSDYVKYSNQPWIYLLFYDTANEGCYFNVQTGAAGGATGTAANCAIQAMPNGWYRVSFTVVSGVTSSGVLAERFATANGTPYSNVGDAYYVYGAEIEPAVAGYTLPTSYMPVAASGSSVRAADVFKPTSPYFANSTNGTACVSFKTLQNVSGAYVLADTAQERALIDFASATNVGSYDGTNSANYALAFQSAGTLNKACVSYSGTSSVAAVNGTAGTSQTFAGSFGLSGLNLFSDYAGAHPTIGWLQSFKFYTPALAGTSLAGAAQ